MCIGCQEWFPATGFFPGPKILTGQHRLTQVELYISKQQSGQYIGRDRDREIDKLENLQGVIKLIIKRFSFKKIQLIKSVLRLIAVTAIAF